MEARLKTSLWVSAQLRVADRLGQPGAVLRKGDADAGAVLVVLRGRQGLVVLSQTTTGQGRTEWMRATGAEPVGQTEVDAYLERRLRHDADIWIVEFESPDLQPQFE